MDNDRNRLALDGILNECSKCGKCELGRRVLNGRLTNVPHKAGSECTYMMVGLCPTIDDMKSGYAFGSDAFKKFFGIFHDETGLSEVDFHFTNVCKCCPYGQRSPLPREIKKCSEYLSMEIDAIKPPIIVALGKVPLKILAGVDDMSKFHGTMVFSGKYRTRVFSMYAPTKQRMGDDGKMGVQLVVGDICRFAEEIKCQRPL